MKYNQTLRKKHEEIRAESVQDILKAIEYIRSNEGDKAIVSASKLTMLTGKSRSLLYKSHILQVWNPDLWEKHYGDKKGRISLINDEEYKAIVKVNEDLIKENNEYKKKNSKLEESIVMLKEKKDSYEKVLNDKIQENQRLKGSLLKYELRLSAADLL